mgnify:CR=1 FL=1
MKKKVKTYKVGQRICFRPVGGNLMFGTITDVHEFIGAVEVQDDHGNGMLVSMNTIIA